MKNKIDPEKVITTLHELKGYLRGKLGNFSDYGTAVENAIGLLHEKGEIIDIDKGKLQIENDSLKEQVRKLLQDKKQ